MMNWITAILTTIGMVCAAVGMSAAVVVVAWLIGYYGPDRVLQMVSAPMAMAGLLSLLSLYICPPRKRSPRYGKPR